MGKHDDMIRQAAVRWYMRMREAAPDAPERTTFEMWLMSDRRHQSAYRLIESTMEDFSSTDRLKNLSNALTQKQFFEKTQRSKKLSKLGSGLATLVLCIGLGWLGQQQYQTWQAAPVSEQSQTTSVAQIAKRTLEDGTVITANANSKLEITYYRHQRLVKLKQGEAIFEVTKDAERPFVVETAQAKVTVLGTRFAVNQMANRVRISVDHGSVRVARADGQTGSLVLRNGQVAEIELHAAPEQVNRNAADGFSFAQGLMVFDRADMFEVAETLSRYRAEPVKALFFGNNTPKINAVLKASEVDAFIRNLPSSVPVVLNRKPDGLVIEPAR